MSLDFFLFFKKKRQSEGGWGGGEEFLVSHHYSLNLEITIISFDPDCKRKLNEKETKVCLPLIIFGDF